MLIIHFVKQFWKWVEYFHFSIHRLVPVGVWVFYKMSLPMAVKQMNISIIIANSLFFLIEAGTSLLRSRYLLPGFHKTSIYFGKTSWFIWGISEQSSRAQVTFSCLERMTHTILQANLMRAHFQRWGHEAGKTGKIEYFFHCDRV